MPSIADLQSQSLQGEGSLADRMKSALGSPASVDNVTARSYIQLDDTNQNGFVVKVAGNDTQYGKGQAFMVLEEGAGDATDPSEAGSVFFRVNGNGSIGTTGSLHVATGLRDTEDSTTAVWIDPSKNVTPLAIHNPPVAESAVWNKDFVVIVDTRNANETIFKIEPTGKITSTKDMTVQDGTANQVFIGAVFGLSGIGFGQTVDTLMYRSAAGIIGVANAFEFPEIAEPAAPAVNKARLYTKDNGAGKTQLCVRFNTGASIVIATQA